MSQDPDHLKPVASSQIVMTHHEGELRRLASSDSQLRITGNEVVRQVDLLLTHACEAYSHGRLCL
jgi:NAD(P)H-hydrate repair Nnr-like enzyme with NAD(P)H-hydrate dehydratase domain